jgi:Zn-dependent protease
MDSLNAGCIRLFKVAGITVLLHWSWFLVAVIEIQNRRGAYGSLAWNAAEYLALFGIVLLHEFGHALACRQVGGTAERIVLWPLGGVAFVSPPPRPGALLWSIAAGPLVNVVLLPVTIGAWLLVHSASVPGVHSPAESFCQTVAIINAGLLIFNMLPIYPLDGGQILHALLWFVMGRARGLQVASVIGMIGAAAGVALAINQQSI